MKNNVFSYTLNTNLKTIRSKIPGMPSVPAINAEAKFNAILKLNKLPKRLIAKSIIPPKATLYASLSSNFLVEPNILPAIKSITKANTHKPAVI